MYKIIVKDKGENYTLLQKLVQYNCILHIFLYTNEVSICKGKHI